MHRIAFASRIVVATLAVGSLVPIACEPGTDRAGTAAPARPAPPTATPDALARLVPADTIAFVRLASLDACEAFLRRALRPFDTREADALDIDRILRDAGVPGDMRAVDRSRPLGIAVSLDREDGAPLLTVIVPVTGRAAFAASVSLLTTAEDGDYIGASQVADYTSLAKPHALAGYLPDTPLALRVDLEALIGAYRSKINLFVAGAFNLIRSSARGDASRAARMSGLLDAYEESLTAVFDSAERLEIGAAMSGAQFDLVADFWAVGGSALGTLGSDEPTDVAALADTVGQDGQMVFLAGADMAALGKRFEHFTTAMIQLVPEPLQDAMEEMLGGWDEVYAAMGTGMAGTLTFDEGGMRMAQVLQPRDVDTLFEMYRRVYAGEEMQQTGLLLEPPRETTTDGLRVLSLRMDLARLAMEAGAPFGLPGAGPGGMPGAGGADADDAEARLRGLFERMYGTGGTPLRVASRGNRLVILMGGDDAWTEDALARMDGGSHVAADIATELERVGRMNPCLVARVDLGRWIREFIAPMVAALDEHAAPIGPVPPAPMVFSVGVAGRTWRGHVSLDIDELGTALRAIGDGR